MRNFVQPGESLAIAVPYAAGVNRQVDCGG